MITLSDINEKLTKAHKVFKDLNLNKYFSFDECILVIGEEEIEALKQMSYLPNYRKGYIPTAEDREAAGHIIWKDKFMSNMTVIQSKKRNQFDILLPVYVG